MSLLVEIAKPGGGWQRIGTLSPGEPAGSMSHNPPGGREVFMFTCHGDHSTLERSVGGGDAELAGGMLREINSVGFEQVARLGPGQKVDLWLLPDHQKRAARVRFRHESDG